MLLLHSELNKAKIMETITLRYDANNAIVRRLLESLIASGIFTPCDEEDFNATTMEAIEEINQGGGIRCNTFEEYLKAIQ